MRARIYALPLVLVLEAATAAAKPAPPPPAAAAPAQPSWQWSGQPDLYPMVELRAKLRRHSQIVLRELVVAKHRAGSTDSHAELRRELTRGSHHKVLWRVEIKDKRWTDLVGAAMVVSGGRIFVARYNRISSTCMLKAFEASTGKQLWSVALQGIGPIAHSKWYNRVQLGIHLGHPVAFGNEGPTMGYVEVRDGATGALVSNARLTVPPPPRVLAEPVYRELLNMLGKAPSYRVSIANFSQRHNLVFASVAARDKAFAKAAWQLNGLPMSYRGSQRRMQVRLSKAGGRRFLSARRK